MLVISRQLAAVDIIVIHFVLFRDPTWQFSLIFPQPPVYLSACPFRSASNHTIYLRHDLLQQHLQVFVNFCIAKDLGSIRARGLQTPYPPLSLTTWLRFLVKISNPSFLHLSLLWLYFFSFWSHVSHFLLTVGFQWYVALSLHLCIYIFWFFSFATSLQLLVLYRLSYSISLLRS